MLSKEFLEIVACPKCKGDLEYRHSETEKDDALICHACRLVFAVVDDIPNLILEEATPLESQAGK